MAGKALDMKIEGGQRIAGVISREGTETFRAVDPTSGSDLPELFHEATPGEIDRAARAAGDASVLFRQSTPSLRASFLEHIAAEIEQLGSVLVERATQETALPAGRIEMERGRTCGQLRSFATALREGDTFDPIEDAADPHRAPLPKPKLIRRKIALGPVAIFGASNFPLAFSVAGGDTASALAAGCPVVVKGHPAHPGTSELVASAIERAVTANELPPATFSLIQGRSPATGGLLIDHPSIRAVGFTGSAIAGQSLWQRAHARARPIPVFAEMGSVNPVYVLPRALAVRGHQIAEGMAASVQLGVGQFCTNPGVVAWVDGEGSDIFLAVLAAELTGAAAGTLLTEGIRRNYDEGLNRLRSTSGVKEIARGGEGSGSCSASAVLHRVDALAFLAERGLAEEVFGPATLAVIAQSEEELVEVAQSFPGQLTATLHGEEEDTPLREVLSPILEDCAGRLIWNGFPTGVEVSPAMHHGGPWPATTDSRYTSVGLSAIERFLRPVSYQDWPT